MSVHWSPRSRENQHKIRPEVTRTTYQDSWSKWECTYPHIHFNEHDTFFPLTTFCSLVTSQPTIAAQIVTWSHTQLPVHSKIKVRRNVRQKWPFPVPDILHITYAVAYFWSFLHQHQVPPQLIRMICMLIWRTYQFQNALCHHSKTLYGTFK